MPVCLTLLRSMLKISSIRCNLGHPALYTTVCISQERNVESTHKSTPRPFIINKSLQGADCNRTPRNFAIHTQELWHNLGRMQPGQVKPGSFPCILYAPDAEDKPRFLSLPSIFLPRISHLNASWKMPTTCAPVRHTILKSMPKIFRVTYIECSLGCKCKQYSHAKCKCKKPMII